MNRLSLLSPTLLDGPWKVCEVGPSEGFSLPSRPLRSGPSTVRVGRV